ncbi:MAG: adenylate/guanylate cyclase domain-containing protein [Aeromicrobium sp.]|uniref:adenylate/guanylate cyclase domain-containing protein n=1 Tax=Aeromicrobium sp. TaxID=1871063 RepID=UPI003C403C23
MADDDEGSLPLPDHPDLRDIAETMELAQMHFEILDERFRCVYVSREWIRFVELSPDEVRRQIGRSLVARVLREDAEIIRVTPESGTAWFEHNASIMRRHINPGDDDFAEIFDAAAPFAAELDPAEPEPRAWYDRVAFPANLRFRRSLVGDQHQLQVRINDDAGRFIGVVFLYRGMVPDSLLQRLGRGDPQLFERMDRVSEPRRRDAAILFADLEASGVISKRLSSRGYFELIRDLTDLIDACVISHGGITGKHAGDGGSALFLAADFNDSESRAARAAIDTAQSIRDGAERLGPDVLEVKVNVGVHWGAQLMIGQVSTHGRLEVTALGDQMNEGARIETAATDGEILASKNLIERLDAHDARETKIDPDDIVYSTLSDLAGASDKAVRDAGTIAVARI